MTCLSIQEVADRWGVGYQTVQTLVHKGKLKAFKPGREYRITQDAVAAFEQGAPEPEPADITVHRDTNAPLKIY